MRTFAEIMREVYRMRKSGVSPQVALLAAIETDADWELIVKKLIGQARLEASLRKYKPGSRPKRTYMVPKNSGG